MRKLEFLKYTPFDWRLLTVVFLMLSIPAIYNSYSIYLIGRWPPSENGLPIVAQWQFVQVFIEILQEALVIPLFFFVGSQRFKYQPELLERVRTALLLVFLLLLLVTTILQATLPFFVEHLQIDGAISAKTIAYLRIQLIATLFLVLNTGLIIVFEVLSKRKVLITLLFIRLVTRILFDALLYGSYPFSLNLGVEGVALSGTLTEGIVLLVSLFFLQKALGVKLNEWLKPIRFSAVRLFARVSKWIAIESGVRNIAYFFVILSLINQLGSKQMGGYYLSMHLFWSFCLLPVNATAEVLKAQIGNYAAEKQKIVRLLLSGFTIGLMVILTGWSLLYLYLGPALRFLNNDPEVIHYGEYAFKALIIPYILLAFNIIADSAFVGTGKTQFLAYQSIFTNLIVYGTAYLAYWAGWWTPSFGSVLFVFSLGILMDSGLTGYYLLRLLEVKFKVIR